MASISYFMLSQAPRRLTATVRSNSTSGNSPVGAAMVGA
jgi:hypothetical protein